MSATEAKPGSPGTKPGQLSPGREWVWLGAAADWNPTQEPQADAVRELNE